MFKYPKDQSPIAAPLIVPNPDPSVLTREKILHDIESVESKLIERIEGVRISIETRLTAMDKAADLFDANLNRIPTNVDRQTGALRDLLSETIEAVSESIEAYNRLNNEKFAGVDRQFTERDVRVLQSAAAATTAVNAALQAAKEAVGEQNKSFTLSIDKSETATMKQIDAQSQSILVATQGLVSTISDVKERLTRIEGQALGKSDSTSAHASSNGMMISIIAVGVSIISALILAGNAFHTAVK